MSKHFSLLGILKNPKNKGENKFSESIKNESLHSTTYQPEFQAFAELKTSTGFQNVPSLNRLFKPHT